MKNTTGRTARISEALSLTETMGNIRKVAKAEHGYRILGVSLLLTAFSTWGIASSQPEFWTLKSIINIIIESTLFPFFMMTFLFSGKETKGTNPFLVIAAFFAGIALTTMFFANGILEAGEIPKTGSDIQALLELCSAGAFVFIISLALIGTATVRDAILRILRVPEKSGI